MKRILNALALSGALGAATLMINVGCAEVPPPDAMFVHVPPPVAVVEVQGAIPGPDFLWISGYHRWDGRAHVWVNGRWERRPRPGAVWENGRWRHHRRGWYWVEGRWR